MKIVKLHTHGVSAELWLDDVNDHIQKTIYKNNEFYEKELLEDAWSRIRPRDEIIDAGANIGNHTIFFSKIMGHKCHSFEPDINNLKTLKINIKKNNCIKNAIVYPIALGEKSSKASIAKTYSGNRGKTTVKEDSDGRLKISTLDDLFINHKIGLIKIDVEGMELKVIKGAKNLIIKNKPIIYVEATTNYKFNLIEKYLNKLDSNTTYVFWKRFNYTPTYLFIPKVIS